MKFYQTFQDLNRVVISKCKTKKSERMKELTKNEVLSITGGYYPPTEKQLENLNPFERIIICW